MLGKVTFLLCVVHIAETFAAAASPESSSATGTPKRSCVSGMFHALSGAASRALGWKQTSENVVRTDDSGQGSSGRGSGKHFGLSSRSTCNACKKKFSKSFPKYANKSCHSCYTESMKALVERKNAKDMRKISREVKREQARLLKLIKTGKYHVYGLYAESFLAHAGEIMTDQLLRDQDQFWSVGLANDLNFLQQSRPKYKYQNNNYVVTKAFSELIWNCYTNKFINKEQAKIAFGFLFGSRKLDAHLAFEHAIRTIMRLQWQRHDGDVSLRNDLLLCIKHYMVSALKKCHDDDFLEYEAITDANQMLPTELRF